MFENRVSDLLKFAKGLDAVIASSPNSCDPVGIQTQDLQNRNLTLYSAKLRDQCFVISGCKGTTIN